MDQAVFDLLAAGFHCCSLLLFSVDGGVGRVWLLVLADCTTSALAL